MSVTVNFRTAKQLKAETIFDAFVQRGEKIIVTSEDFPCLKLGTFQESLRGIEINKEKRGYEVRICSFANRADLNLFVVAAEVMKGLTGSKALMDDDDDQEIVEPREYLNEKWIKEQLDSSMTVNCILVKSFGAPMIMDGLFFSICFGPYLAKSFDLKLSEPHADAFNALQDYLTSLQWHFADKENTSTRLALPNPNDKDGEPLHLSIICAKDGEVQPFDYVSYADILCLMDQDKDEVTMVHMEDFPKLIQSDEFTMMDEYQFAVDGKLSYDTFRQMVDKASLYKVDDLFYRPTFPGNGYDDKQRTYVLMWNPEISSVKMNDFVADIPELLTGDFNWSVYEYQKAKKGDRFVLIRCGEGRTGFVMSGVFDSNPYQAGDWSGKGRKVFYMDLKPNFIADPEHLDNFLATGALRSAIPSFDWSGGHSGHLMTDEQAKQLETLLAAYLPQFHNNLDEKTVNGFSLPQDNSMDF